MDLDAIQLPDADPTQLALLGAAAVLLILVLALSGVRRARGEADALRAEVAALRQAAAGRDADLRQTARDADRFEALAEERRVEIDRLNGDLSKLRLKLDAEGERLMQQAGAVSRLEAEVAAVGRSARERIELLDRGRREIEERHAQWEADRTARIERLTAETQDLRKRLEAEVQRQQTMGNEISRLRTELSAQQEAAAEKLALLQKIRGEMEARFRDLAGEALKQQGEQFSATSIERLQATLTPLKEHVGHFERELKAVHKATIDDRAALKAEIAHLSQRSEAISREAVMLTRALRSDQQKQGAWGEMILENILERSGLRAGEEYETQANRTGAEGDRLRPDVVVRIPDGKTLVIDSKVSLLAYSEAVNAEDEAEAAAARRRHAASLRSHINGLAMKDYQHAEDSTVDYVIMFVPIEGALSEALREDGGLTEYALERSITIATPTTLMMALRTVAHVWAVQRRNRNAEAIARRAGLIHDKVAGFLDSMENLGKRLDQARGAYDDAFGKLSRGRGNLLSQVDQLKALGAKTSKNLGVGEVAEEAAPPPLASPDKDG